MIADIIYIAGVGRSGSTLLDRTLGSAEGMCTLGELNAIWSFGYNENVVCSCGETFYKCTFWTQVRKHSGIQHESSEKHYMDNFINVALGPERTKSFPKFFLLSMLGVRSKTLNAYMELQKQLYQGVALACNQKILIDSSKSPFHLYWLSRIPGIRLHVVHLVRDPRATVFSWMNPKFNPGRKQSMMKYSLFRGSLLWVIRNLAVEMLRFLIPIHRMKYEDLMSSPKSEVNALMNKMGLLNVSFSSFQDEHTVDLKPIHTISGNPVRFKSGATKISYDDRFKRDMPLFSYWVSTLITLPLLLAYKYKLR